MFGLDIFLTALKVIPAAVAIIPEVKATIDAAISVLHPDSQDAAKAGYAALVADNDEGFAELDRLAAEAAAN